MHRFTERAAFGGCFWGLETWIWARTFQVLPLEAVRQPMDDDLRRREHDEASAAAEIYVPGLSLLASTHLDPQAGDLQQGCWMPDDM